MAQGLGIWASLEAVNSWCSANGLPTISEGQLKVDRAHVRELIQEDGEIARHDHIQSLQLLKQGAWWAWDDRSESAKGRSRMLGAVLDTEKELMRLSGVLDRSEVAAETDKFRQRDFPEEVLASPEYNDAVDTLLSLLPADPDGGASARLPR
jgi:hypothetical protein